jgi:mono/diheme cytochrome c family protein
MMRRAAACFAILSLGILAAGAACRPGEGREQRDFERMRVQQRYDAYGRSRFFRDGAVMQAPPAHTIARAAEDPWSGRVETSAYLTGAVGASDVAEPPIALDSSLRAAGREQYRISCAPCHGAGGYGGGVMAANLAAKRPPSLRTPPVSTLPAGTIFKVITEGLGRMPPYGWQIPTRDRWAVVAYVRSLATLPPTPAAREDSMMAAFLRRLDSAQTLNARLQLAPPRGTIAR